MTNASVSVVRFLFSNNKRDNLLLFINFCLLIFGSLVVAAPKSRNRDGPQLVYDQKQTGDYNIQLHLKDFQIIALLGDDSLGDYDYNYDYADFTIKPTSSSSTSTTPKPSTTTTTTSSSSTPTIIAVSSTTKKDSTSAISSTTTKPAEILIPENPSNEHPYPIEVVVLKPSDDKKIITKASKGSNEQSDKKPEITLNEIISSTTLQTSTDPSTNSSSSTSSIPILDKIKVQILEAPTPTELLAPVPIGIVPGEDVLADGNDGALHGELANYRKCASGFSRDKRGRCRRIRRPGVGAQLPYAFGRIAGNLATRLRLPNHEKTVDAQSSAQLN